MAHGATSIGELPLRRLDPTPGALRTGFLVLVVLGAAAVATALLVDAPRAWRAWVANWLFWASIAQGGVMLAVIVTIAHGVWSRSVRRFALSLGAFLPVAFLLILPPLLFAGDHLFPWVGDDLHGKEVWLNVPFLAARNIIGLAILFAFSLFFMYWSVRPDLDRARGEAGARYGGFYGRFTRGWRGEAEEAAIADRKVGRMAPGLALVYVAVFSLVAFDFVMSLDWHWWSTLIGGYFFMGAVLGGVAATAIAVVAFRGTMGLTDYISASQLHDLGKLLFAFAVFWAYLFWSQYLVIWYGKLPWATGFVVERFEQPFGTVALLVFLCLFVLPFFGLLGVKPKRTPAILATFAAIVLIGLWLERWVLTYPSHYPGAERLPLGWPELGTALLFGGLFLASVSFFLARVPVFQLWLTGPERDELGPTAEWTPPPPPDQDRPPVA